MPALEVSKNPNAAMGMFQGVVFVAFLILAVPWLCKAIGRGAETKVKNLFLPVRNRTSLQELRKELGSECFVQNLLISVKAWVGLILCLQLVEVVMPSSVELPAHLGTLLLYEILGICYLAVVLPLFGILVLAVFALVIRKQ